MGATGKDDLEKVKQKRGRGKSPQKRKKNVRERQVRFLIVCEGTKTEPNYFSALIRDNTSTVIDVEIWGEGQGASDLVDKAVKIKESLEKRNAMSFDRVWVVFDKDDRTDFNKAIDKANKLGFKSAWSNESFELWFCLHFEYLNTPIGRSDYIKKLEGFFSKGKGDNNFKYKKGSSDIYELLKAYGNEDSAKAHAKNLRALYDDDNYAEHNPCTMVDILVEELEHPEKIKV
ncbi:RloB family protein [Porphyromonas endodontalis]